MTPEQFKRNIIAVEGIGRQNADLQVRLADMLTLLDKRINSDLEFRSTIAKHQAEIGRTQKANGEVLKRLQADLLGDGEEWKGG